MRSFAVLAANIFYIVSYDKYGLLFIFQESSATCIWKGWTNFPAGFIPHFLPQWHSRVQLPTR
jgi:hypothetical protein